MNPSVFFKIHKKNPFSNNLEQIVEQNQEEEELDQESVKEHIQELVYPINQEDEINTSKTNINYVDQVTMEYMMNRSHYKKYLAVTNKDKYQETKNKIELYGKYYDNVSSIFNELFVDFMLNGNFSKYNRSLQNDFENFVESAIHHIKENEKIKNLKPHYNEDNELNQEDECLF